VEKMYYINVLEQNSEFQLIIQKKIFETLNRIMVGNQSIDYGYSAYDEEYIAINFLDNQIFAVNTFHSLEFIDNDNNLIDVGLKTNGTYPFLYNNDTQGLLVSFDNELLIKFVKTFEVVQKLKRSNQFDTEIVSFYEVNNLIGIHFKEINKEQQKNLIVLAKKKEDNQYYYVPALFNSDEILIDQTYFSGKYDLHVLILVNSTLFKCSFMSPNKMVERDYISIFEGNNEDVDGVLDQQELLQMIDLDAKELREEETILVVDNIDIRDNSLSFEIANHEEYNPIFRNPILLLRKRKAEDLYLVEGKKNIAKFTFNFNAFLNDANGSNRWDLFLLRVGLAKKHTIYRLQCFEPLPEDKPTRFFNFFKQPVDIKSTYNQKSRLYITNKNELSLTRNNISNLIKEQLEIKTQIDKFSMKKNVVNIRIKMNTPYIDQFKTGSVYLVQRNKDNLLKKGYPHAHVKKHDTGSYIECQIDLLSEELFPLYWDVYLGVFYNDNEYLIRVTRVSKKVFKDIDSTISKYQLNVNNEYIIYPYITITKDLSFTFRKREYFENRYYLFKENIAYYFVNLFYRYFSEKDIWIGFEKLAMSAHDSGYHFFDYVYKNKKHENFYYVIRKGSPEEDNLKDKKDKILYFMSFKYFVYMFAARLLISSDTKRNSYNLSLKKSKLAKTLTDKKLVYLQHGVNGLKVVKDFYKNRGVFDLVIAPSEYEREMIIEHWGYDDSEVVTTGLARWDVLEDKTDEISYKQIFVMPTWRTWMDGMTKDKFLESEYFQRYNDFLSSSRLENLLKENNVKIMFFLHPKFKEYIDLFNFESDQIEKFGFLEVPLDEMIMKSSLMISDYSSVIWEMFYLKKPCVFFHFDRDKYLDYEGSYMDFDNDLFGDVAYDTETLVDIIESYIKNEFQEKQHYGQLRNEYFTYIDKNNSERIYQAIQENKDMLYKESNIRKWKLTHIIPFKLRRMGLSAINKLLKK